MVLCRLNPGWTCHCICLIGAISRVQWTCHCILSYWAISRVQWTCIVFCLIGAISRVQWTCHCILSYWGHIQGPDKINTAINQTVEESLPHAVYQPLGRVIQTGLKHLYTTHVGKMTHLMIYDNTECVCNDLLFYTFFLFNENNCKSKSTNKRETLK